MVQSASYKSDDTEVYFGMRCKANQGACFQGAPCVSLFEVSTEITKSILFLIMYIFLLRLPPSYMRSHFIQIKSTVYSNFAGSNSTLTNHRTGIGLRAALFLPLLDQ